MENLALGKPVAEPIVRPELLTDGLVSGYDGMEGFTLFPWPGYATVDLGQPQLIKTIRFLLWDNRGRGIGPADPRGYKYRLLVSSDRQDWTVLFDTGGQAYNGWQVFHLREPTLVQYIRLHGLHNTANSDIHVVELEAYADVPPPVDSATVECEVGPETYTTEHGDGLPIEQSISAIVNSFERVLAENNVLNPVPFTALISQLKLRVSDISFLERRMGAVQRQLVDPVAAQLERGKRYSVGGYWFGALGLVATLVSLTFYFWDKFGPK